MIGLINAYFKIFHRKLIIFCINNIFINLKCIQDINVPTYIYLYNFVNRVTNRCAELEKNNDLEREKANSLKEGQCDIIAYLSRQVEMKNNEIIDLENTVSTLKTVCTCLLFTHISTFLLYCISTER